MCLSELLGILIQGQVGHPAPSCRLLQLLSGNPNFFPQGNKPQTEGADLALVRLVVGGEGGQVRVQEGEGGGPLVLVLVLVPDQLLQVADGLLVLLQLHPHLLLLLLQVLGSSSGSPTIPKEPLLQHLLHPKRSYFYHT